MIGRRKKATENQRLPQINRQKQAAFQYSSNRTATDRLQRKQPSDKEPALTLPRLKLAAFRLVHALILLGVIGIIVLLSLLIKSPETQISGTQTVRNHDEYAAAVSDIAGSGILNRSKLTINRTDIADALQQKFPELQNIDVTTPLLGLSVKVTAEITPAVAILETSDKRFLINNSGIAVMELKNTTTVSEELVSIQDQTGAPIMVGKPALTSVQSKFIDELLRQGSSKQISFDQLILAAGGGELDARYSGTNYIVKYNLYEDARKSFGTYFATREYLEGTRTNIAEYIDVRVPERAYVK